MRAADGGAIVNVSSIFGVAGADGYIAYCASKAAVVGMSKTAALELAADRIRVNASVPVESDADERERAAKRCRAVDSARAAGPCREICGTVPTSRTTIGVRHRHRDRHRRRVPRALALCTPSGDPLSRTLLAFRPLSPQGVPQNRPEREQRRRKRPERE